MGPTKYTVGIFLLLSVALSGDSTSTATSLQNQQNSTPMTMTVSDPVPERSAPEQFQKLMTIGNMDDEIANVSNVFLLPSKAEVLSFPSNRELLDRIFVVSLICLITVANMLMGCELDLGAMLATIKRPAAPAIGFFAQFVIMPLLAYSIALLVLSPAGDGQMHLLSLGLFLTGCSPGGGASNYWTVLLDGNTNLSITMTFVSMIAAMVMMPLWIRLLGPRLIEAAVSQLPFSPTFAAGSRPTSVRIPYAKIVGSLLTLSISLLIGLLIAKFRPQLALKARKILRPFIVVVLTFLLIFGILINIWLLKMITWPILLAGFLLPFCGFMFGCLTSVILGQDARDVTAIAIETGVQNTGIAIMMLKLSLPGPPSDIASLAPILVACFTPLSPLLCYLFHSAIRRRRQRENERIREDKPKPTDQLFAEEESMAEGQV